MGYPMDLDEYDEVQLNAELDCRKQRRADGKCDYCNRPFKTQPSCKFPERHAGEV